MKRGGRWGHIIRHRKWLKKKECWWIRNIGKCVRKYQRNVLAYACVKCLYEPVRTKGSFRAGICRRAHGQVCSAFDHMYPALPYWKKKHVYLGLSYLQLLQDYYFLICHHRPPRIYLYNHYLLASTQSVNLPICHPSPAVDHVIRSSLSPKQRSAHVHISSCLHARALLHRHIYRLVCRRWIRHMRWSSKSPTQVGWFFVRRGFLHSENPPPPSTRSEYIRSFRRWYRVRKRMLSSGDPPLHCSGFYVASSSRWNAVD